MISLVAASIFLLVTGTVVIGIIVAMMRLGRRSGMAALIILFGWLTLTGVLAARGVLGDFSTTPPRVMLIAGGAMFAMALMILAPLGRRLALATPIAWLIGFQAFRVGVEICLSLLYHAGIVPAQMTLEGRNWDMLTGLTALPMAWLWSRGRISRGWLLVWNVAGLALLLNILIVSILSMPTALRVFPDGPANTFVTTAPYVWLPALLVPTALGGHLLALRYLLATRGARTAAETAMVSSSIH